jgi:hypothetical protein
MTPPPLRALPAEFLAFGVSDVVKAQPGAWCRPVWLLIGKAACVGVFAYGLWQTRRINSAHPEQADEVQG